jgi:multidrug efflux pump subunit AcrB
MEVACDLSREEATLLEVAIPNAYDRLDAAADQVENAILQSPLHYAHSIRLPVENDVIRLLLTGTERESVDRAMSNLARQLPQFTVRDCQVGLGCLAPFPVKAMLYGADEARLRQWAEATAKGVQSIGMSAAAVATGSEIPVPTMVVDREKAARASIPVEEIDRALRSVDKKSLLDPQTASDTLSRITVTDRNGIRLGLSSVVQLKIESQPRAVVRWDGRRVILINAATMPGKTNPETEAVLAAAAAEERSSLRLPEDYVIIGAVK